MAARKKKSKLSRDIFRKASKAAAPKPRKAKSLTPVKPTAPKKRGSMNVYTNWMLEEQERRRKGKTPRHSRRGRR
jgi:hypothetical protein